MNDYASTALFNESQKRVSSSKAKQDLPICSYELYRFLSSIPSTSQNSDNESLDSNTGSPCFDIDLPHSPRYDFCDQLDLNGNVIDWRAEVILKSVRKIPNIKTYFPEFPNRDSKNSRILK